jgi:hypothetical protein
MERFVRRDGMAAVLVARSVAGLRLVAGPRAGPTLRARGEGAGRAALSAWSPAKALAQVAAIGYDAA